MRRAAMAGDGMAPGGLRGTIEPCRRLPPHSCSCWASGFSQKLSVELSPQAILFSLAFCFFSSFFEEWNVGVHTSLHNPGTKSDLLVLERGSVSVIGS